MLDFLTTIFADHIGRVSFDLRSFTGHADGDGTFHVLHILINGKECVSLHLDDQPKIDTISMISVAERIRAIQEDLV